MGLATSEHRDSHCRGRTDFRYSGFRAKDSRMAENHILIRNYGMNFEMKSAAARILSPIIFSQSAIAPSVNSHTVIVSLP